MWDRVSADYYTGNPDRLNSFEITRNMEEQCPIPTLTADQPHSECRPFRGETRTSMPRPFVEMSHAIESILLSHTAIKIPSPSLLLLSIIGRQFARLAQGIQMHLRFTVLTADLIKHSSMNVLELALQSSLPGNSTLWKSTISNYVSKCGLAIETALTNILCSATSLLQRLNSRDYFCQKKIATGTR